MSSLCPMKPSRPVSSQPDRAVISAKGDWLPAAEIAHAVAGRKMSALECHRSGAGADRAARSGAQCIHRCGRRARPRHRARHRCRDRRRQDAGPLAGVPFAVKNLFDVKGLPTRAGSKINRDLAPSPRDATLIERLEAAGAVLVGALNMGEYAYDFTGENVHDGNSRNPHDVDADDRRLVRRLRRRGRRRAGAAGAGLRHQRVDPGAVVVLRHVRPEADLWPAVAGALVSVRREPRSSRPVRAQRRGSGAGL